MKKNIQKLAFAFLLGGALSLNAQVSIQPCNTYDAMEQVFAADPSARVRYEKEQKELQEAYEKYEASLKVMKPAAFQYTIPVVFHVLHQYGPENISDATLVNAVAQINSDFAATGGDVSTISPLFSSLYTNSDIKVMLAHKDPMGNCTNGIIHHYNVNTNWNQSQFSNYAYTGTAPGQWNPSKYLNIYIVKQICPTTSTCSASGGIVVGYTYKPGTWSSGASQDAIVYHYQFLSGLQARSLTHEIGHWLNLSHPWGNTNNPGVACGNDGIGDTPLTKGFFSTCPGSPWSGCTAGGENVENFMDYSSCPKMFTSGQTTAMRTALASATSGRSNLWSASNLGSSGTDVDGSGVCAPIADFYANSGVTVGVYTVCTGGSLTFIDASYNAAVTSRTWSATGGATIANPNNSSTGITFSSVGIQTVTLVASNAQGSSTATRTINVLNGLANYNATYQESFENVGLPANFSVINQTGGTTWQQYFGSGASGNNSYYINGSIDPSNAVDILETPTYDFLNNPGATFTFKYAYAKYSSVNADAFVIQASSNCGGSWSQIYAPSNTTMASGSGGTTTSPYFPASGSSQWKTYTITANPLFNIFKSQPTVKIRFQFTEDVGGTGFGNNIFLDDINFNTPLGVNELTKSIFFNLYPNPSTGAATIEFTLSDNSDIKYSVTDVIGRIVENEKALNNMAPGTHQLSINSNQNLRTGIYFVNFEINGQKILRKLIIE
jgi:hypothetical protein